MAKPSIEGNEQMAVDDYKSGVITRDLNDGSYHDITRKTLTDLMDGLGHERRVLEFQSPTGTGKTFMVCRDDDGNDDKWLLLVPTVTQSDQVAEDYGVKVINGGVETLSITPDDRGLVSTYDGLKRFMKLVPSPTEWTLYIDESHQLTGSAGFRGRAVDYITAHALGFGGVVLMSATPHHIKPIQPTSFCFVRQAYKRIPFYHTTSENYIGMAKEELKREGNDVVYVVANNKDKLTALARVAVSQGLTVGIMTSDLKESVEFKAILSGELKPQIIFCTCIIYDGLNIDPSHHSIIVTRYTKIRGTELVQLSSRNRASGKPMIKPSRVIVCIKEPIFEAGPEIESVDQKIEDVTRYCEILTAMYAHLKNIGRFDETVNKVMDISYSHMVTIDHERLDFSPNLSHCIGEYEDEKRHTMTLGDLIDECRAFNIIYEGELEFDDCDLLELTTKATKEVKVEVKKDVAANIEEMVTACDEGTIKEYLAEALDPKNAHRKSKKALTAIASLASARRTLTKSEGYQDHMFRELSQGVDTASKAKLFKAKVSRHLVVSLALEGQGASRDDVATIRNMWDMYEVGHEFTGAQMAQDYELCKAGPLAGLGLPKRAITLAKQIFELDMFNLPKDENGKRQKAYIILRKKTMTDRIKEMSIK